MHGGEHHPPPPPLLEQAWSPKWLGTHRRVRYPVQFNSGDKIKCDPPGEEAHSVTFQRTMIFDTEEELRIYICDCIENQS